MPGKIVHFEVPADETGRALGFYDGLFGWRFEDVPGPVEYHLAEISEGTRGAVHRADQGGGIPRIFVYFDVDDINAAVKRVRDLVGDADEPGAEPQMGCYARCADTDGNRFGLWQVDEEASTTAAKN